MLDTLLLAAANLDWTSPSWNSTFSSIFKQDCQRALSTLTSQPTVDTSLFASSPPWIPPPRKTSYASLSCSLLGREGLKHQTIKCYLSGIRFHNIAQSLPDPFIKDMPRLHYVLQDMKSEEAKHQAPRKQRLPVTPAA